MPSRPRPRPTPKAFDVFKPGKTVASPTSRPVIVSQKPQVQDHMMIEQHGAPVANTHPVKVVTRAKQPVLKSLVTPGSPNAPHQGFTPPAETKAEAQVPTTPTSPTRISHTGHIIGRAAGAAGKHAALLHHNKVSPPRGRGVEAKEAAEPEVPNLAAIPITPVEQPASLANAKTEGKEELFAAMPVEIRRSIANAEGQSAADWDMPAADPAALAPAATSAPAEAADANPVAAEQSAPQHQTSSAEVAASETPPPPASAKQPEHTEQHSAHAPVPLMKTERRHSDAIVFIIMLVLFVGLGAVVVMLFLTGTISV